MGVEDAQLEFIVGHCVVRRLIPLDAISLGQEDIEILRLQHRGQPTVKELLGFGDEHASSAEGAVEVDGGAYEGEVGEGLGEVAECLA